MAKVLIVTNDFPPRSGGIQSFVHALATGLVDGGGVVVYAPAWEGAAEFDARQPFPVVRHPTSLMLPVPGVAKRARAILTEHECDTVLFGAAAPLGLLAPGLRAAGARRIVALTHGHEAGWAALPGARALLKRIGNSVDVMTYLGEYFRIRLARALSPAAAARMVRLAPGVDNEAFRPDAGRAERDAIKAKLGIAAGHPCRDLRFPPSTTQGPGHPDPSLAKGTHVPRPPLAPRPCGIRPCCIRSSSVRPFTLRPFGSRSFGIRSWGSRSFGVRPWGFRSFGSGSCFRPWGCRSWGCRPFGCRPFSRPGPRSGSAGAADCRRRPIRGQVASAREAGRRGRLSDLRRLRALG